MLRPEASSAPSKPPTSAASTGFTAEASVRQTAPHWRVPPAGTSDDSTKLLPPRLSQILSSARLPPTLLLSVLKRFRAASYSDRIGIRPGVLDRVCGACVTRGPRGRRSPAECGEGLSALAGGAASTKGVVAPDPAHRHRCRGSPLSVRWPTPGCGRASW